MRRVGWNNRKETLFAILFSIVGSALFFRGPLFLPEMSHVPYDLEGFHQPLSELIASSLRETGTLPWWNPYSYMGEPFAGNLQSAMFYPPTLIAALAGNLWFGRVTIWLMGAQVAAHVALAGIGMYLLLRRLGTTYFPALAGAAIYHLGAFFASQAQHLGAVAEAAWLPWFLAALHRLEERRDWASTAVASVPLALMVLNGFPAVNLPVLVFAPLIYAFWLWRRHPRLEWRAHSRALLLFAAAFVLGAMISAVSWLPGYQVGKHSIASLRPAGAALFGYSLEAATSLFWPNLFNQLKGAYWLPQSPTFLHLYQGIPALLLVVAGFRWLIRSPASRPFLAAAVIAGLWMFGTSFFVSSAVYLLFPDFIRRGIYPHYVLAYFSLFFAVLASLVLDGWERGELRRLFQPRVCNRGALLAVAVASLVLLAGGFAPAGSSIGVRAVNAGSTLLLAALAAALCGFLMRFNRADNPAGRRRVSAAFCAVIVFDLLAVGSNTQLNTNEGRGDSPPPSVEFVRARLGPNPVYRADTSDAGWWDSKTPQWQIPSANGSNPLLLLHTALYRAAFSIQLFDGSYGLDSAESPLLDLAGIRYIVTRRPELAGAQAIYREDMNVFENHRAFPRFFLVGAAMAVDGIAEALQLIKTRQVDPQKVVLVPPGEIRHFAGISTPAGLTEAGSVELLEYRPNEFRVRVTAPQPAAFVAAETFTHDWRATLDGESCPLVRGNGVFRAIPVPAGTHEIHVFIRPRMLYYGAAIAILGLVLAGCCWLPALRRMRRGV